MLASFVRHGGPQWGAAARRMLHTPSGGRSTRVMQAWPGSSQVQSQWNRTVYKTSFGVPCRALATTSYDNSSLDIAAQVLRTANVVNIREELSDLRVRHIPFKQYVAICGKYGLDEKDAVELSEHLHRSGVALHFKDRDANLNLVSDELEQYMILHPDEVIEGVLRRLDLKTNEVSDEIMDLEKKIRIASIEYNSEKSILAEMEGVASRSATRQMWTLGGYLVLQCGLFAHLTWFGVPEALDWMIADWFQTWDEVEPFSWHVGYASVVMGSIFYAKNRADFNFGGIYDRVYQAKMKRLYKRVQFDVERFSKLESSIKTWEEELEKLQEKNYFDVMGTIALQSTVRQTSEFVIGDIPHVTSLVANQLVIPARAIKVRRALKVDGRTHLPYSEFEKICAVYSVEGQEVEELAESLNQSGVVLWLNDKTARNMMNIHPERVLAAAFNSINMYGTGFSEKIDQLHSRLNRLMLEHDDLSGHKEHLNHLATKSANRKLWLGAGYLITQMSTFAYLTVDWGWDITEPMTFHTSFATGILWYFWFSYHKSEGNYTDLQHWLKERALKRLYKKESFDMPRMKELEGLIAQTRDEITQLQPYSLRGRLDLPEDAVIVPPNVLFAEGA